MDEINLSVKDDYHSQVNNRFYPMVACMPTSFIMALKAERIPVVQAGTRWHEPPVMYYPKGMQPEDYVMALMRSPWGYEMRDQYSWAKAEDLNPNEVHAVMSEGINRIIGDRITQFVACQTVQNIINEIRGGHPVVVSGSFTGSGHAVAVVGLAETGGREGKVTHFIIDDPYGRFPDYIDRRGNDVHITIETFDRLWPGWFHRFRRTGGL
jgi:hypothetical protein